MTIESNNLPVLPPDYYLINFLTLINYVEEQYQDLLEPAEIDFVKGFRKISPDSQKLYVRLISRKGPFFRQDKLNYEEIEDIEKTVGELVDKQLMLVNPRVEIRFALQVLTRPELINLASNLDSGMESRDLAGASKRDIVDFICSQDESEVWEYLEQKWHFLLPMHLDTISLYFLLFFGNMQQNLSDFILEDIGVLRYESYQIRKEDRLFQERSVVDSYMEIHNLRLLLWEALEQKNPDEVERIGKLLKAYTPPESLLDRIEKSFNEVGGFYERQKLWDKAMEYYALSSIPPSRERRARLLNNLGSARKALVLTNEIIADPVTEEEKEFAVQFSEKLKRKMGLQCKPMPRESFTREEIEISKKEDQNIEANVLAHMLAQGNQGFHSENGIWTALFGLVFWDIIFMPLPGVFFNPYQRGPVDLFKPGFREKREKELQTRILEIKEEKNWKEILLDRYDKKLNTANLLVPWKRINREQVEQVMSWIPKRDILTILERMTARLKEFRSGFPDLVIYDPGKKQYCLMEVKGPGDQLRPNQKQWLRFFKENQIPCKVLLVKWLD